MNTSDPLFEQGFEDGYLKTDIPEHEYSEALPEYQSGLSVGSIFSDIKTVDDLCNHFDDIKDYIDTLNIPVNAEMVRKLYIFKSELLTYIDKYLESEE